VGKTVAIVQSCYIPWKGYFDVIQSADVFVLYDDVQYTRRDWRNRNQIKTAAGPRWITIPVNVKGRYHQHICDVTISDADWADRHWKSIRHAYARAPYFDRYASDLEALYRDCDATSLSEINERFLRAICAWFSITTPIVQSNTFTLSEDRTDRLIEICRQLDATHYLSGPAAKAYIDEDLFAAAGIEVVWMDYDGYPEYSQLYSPFVHEVSALDLLLNVGPDAPRYMKSFDRKSPMRAAAV
jgi:hypothetical protein